MKTPSEVLKKAVKNARKKRATHREFPYARVARLWEKDYTIREIAVAIGRYDEKQPQKSLHTMRVFLSRMHAGWKDSKGVVHKLPHRISIKALKRATRAGKLAGK